MADEHPNTRKPLESRDAYGFEETRTEILAEAAAGNWDRFLEKYLEPCWRELVIVCRMRGMSLTDAEDIRQEFVARLMQEGQFGGRTRQELSEEQGDAAFRGNMPARYLKFRESSLRSAKFRTYLKQAIRWTVIEELRRLRRRSTATLSAAENEPLHWIEASVSRSLDRRWAQSCLTEAVKRFSSECASARTRGRRRLFAVLYLNTVMEQSHEAIAKAYGIHRTRVTKLIEEAREQLLAHVRRISGVETLEYLRELLEESPAEVKKALDQGVLPDAAQLADGNA